MVFTEVIDPGGGLATLDLGEGFKPPVDSDYPLSELDYPVTILTKDAAGNVVGERTVRTEEEAESDIPLLVAVSTAVVSEMMRTDLDGLLAGATSQGGPGMVFAEVTGADGGPATLVDVGDGERFALSELDYPVTILTKDAAGNVVGERTVHTEGEAEDDDVLLAADMRSDLLESMRTNPEDAGAMVQFYRIILEAPGVGEEDREIFGAVLKGIPSKPGSFDKNRERIQAALALGSNH